METASDEPTVVRSAKAVVGRAFRSGTCRALSGLAVGGRSQHQAVPGLLGFGAGAESVGTGADCSGQQQPPACEGVAFSVCTGRPQQSPCPT